MGHNDHQDDDDEDVKQEKEDDIFNIDEIVLGALILLAPPGIRDLIVDRIRAEVSIKAGEAARELMKTVMLMPTVDVFLAEAKKDLDPHLQGPIGERTIYSPMEMLQKLFDKMEKSGAPVMVATMNNKGELHEVDVDRLAPKAFAEATPNCNCLRCEYIKEMEAKGLRLKNDGTTVPFDRLN